jgi:hypothetical protein
MARFYFHLRAGDRLISDEEGMDLPDVSAARREAVRRDERSTQYYSQRHCRSP